MLSISFFGYLTIQGEKLWFQSNTEILTFLNEGSSCFNNIVILENTQGIEYTNAIAFISTHV
jgi:hypothetical protein